MNIIFKLALAQLRRSKIRLGLSLAAMTVTISLIVWLMGTYDQMISQFDDEANIYMGEYQLTASPASGGGIAGLKQNNSHTQPDSPQKRRGGKSGIWIPENELKRIKEMSGVITSDAAVQTRVSMVSAARWKPRYVPMREQIGPQRDPYLIGISTDHAKFPMEKGRWFSSETLMEGVLGSGAAARLNVGVGDSVYINSQTGDFFVQIVGIVTQPKETPGVNMRGKGGGPAASSLFVSLPTAAKINGFSNKYNLIWLELEQNVIPDIFREQNSSPVIQFHSARDLKDRFENERSVNSMRSQAYSTTGVALLCAVFIIFTTLSMGLSERIRQFAILRALGLRRIQIGGLIAGESLMLAIPAWILGLLSGTVLIALLRSGRPDLHIELAHISGHALFFSAAAAIVGALIAAILPAWQAMRINPLDAMKPMAGTYKGHAQISRGLFIAGLLLISANPILVHLPGIPFELRQTLYITVGYSTLAIGFLCLTPALIRLCELLFLPLIATLLGFNPVFLQKVFSGNLWRTVGTAAALTIGLSLYTSFQFWGYSMVVPFLPDQSTPDALAVFTPSGLPDSDTERVRAIPGVDSSAFLVIAGEQAKFAEQQRQSPAFAQVGQDNLLLLGVDPDRAFSDSNPMFQFNYVKGTREEALRMMKKGRACIIPGELHQPTGLSVGDTIYLVPPKHPNQILEYAIAGVVDIPGWHWLSKHSGLRRKGGFTAGMAFTTYQQVKTDFELPRSDFFWFNTLPGTDLRKLESNMQRLAEAYPGLPIIIEGVGEIPANRPYVKITGRSDIYGTVSRLASNSIESMSRMPLIVLIIASLAVINTMIASIRSRMWELGVMRAVGLTRSALFKIIITESLMTGLIACVLSLLFGIVSAKCGIDICRWGYHFGGVTPDLQIPWSQLSFGFGLTLLLCLLAALIPAWHVARTHPLTLLQNGRSLNES